MRKMSTPTSNEVLCSRCLMPLTLPGRDAIPQGKGYVHNSPERCIAVLRQEIIGLRDARETAPASKKIVDFLYEWGTTQRTWGPEGRQAAEAFAEFVDARLADAPPYMSNFNELDSSSKAQAQRDASLRSRKALSQIMIFVFGSIFVASARQLGWFDDWTAGCIVGNLSAWTALRFCSLHQQGSAGR